MTEANKQTLWETLRVIDRKATKPFTRSGGFRGTQIDPVWRIQRMTEVFGPVGEGWGWEQTGDRITDGMVFVGVRVWYLPAGEKPKWPEHDSGAPLNARWTGPQWGGDVLMLTRGGKTQPNDEAFKMAMTDALGKALLSIGLAADVYMGLFDDSKYRDLSEREADKPAEPTDGEKGAAAALKLGFDGCESVEQLEGFWREHKANIADLPQTLKQEVIHYASDRKRLLVAPGHPAE